MRAVRSRQGDTADLIARRDLGDEALAARVLDANPGLAAHGPVIATGTRVVLPETPPRVLPPVTLW